MIDAAEVETRADEILGPVSGTEYDLLLSKLAGSRGNRVFSFFDIKAPQSATEALLAVQKAASKTGGTGGDIATLEKKKRKKGGAGPGGAKRLKLLDMLTSSPLRRTRESEDDGGKGSPIIAAQPLSAIAPASKPSPILEYSAMEPGRDDELAREVESALADPRLPQITTPAAPSSATSTSSSSTSLSSGKGVEGRGSGAKT